MGKTQSDERIQLIEKLLKADSEFRRHFKTHQTIEAQLDEMNRRPGLSPEEEMERKRLQKTKLHHKDQMEVILRQAGA